MIFCQKSLYLKKRKKEKQSFEKVYFEKLRFQNGHGKRQSFIVPPDIYKLKMFMKRIEFIGIKVNMLK